MSAGVWGSAPRPDTLKFTVILEGAFTLSEKSGLCDLLHEFALFIGHHSDY